MTQTDEEILRTRYAEMYLGMIAKDTETLRSMMTDDSVLIHMTGLRQTREVYLRSIADGTLNYYSCDNSEIDLEISGDDAKMIGRSQVNAAVFGGGRLTWPLRLDIDWKKIDGVWKITEIRAYTF